MLKKLFAAACVALMAALAAKAFNLFDGHLPADAPPPLAGQNEWPALQRPVPPSQPRAAGPEIQRVRQACFGQSSSAASCELLAALTRDEAVRARALRAAARAVRDAEPQRADALLLLAATESAQALTEYGLAPGREGNDSDVRVEALVEAGRVGNTRAATSLSRGYGLEDGQAIARPLWAALLLNGHSHAIPDTAEARSWLYSVGAGLQATCPFERALFETASFRRSQQRFAAGLVARTHDSLIRTAPDAARHFGSAFQQFGSDVGQGADYRAAAENLFNRLRLEHHRLNHAGAIGSEEGARDAVRLADLVGGCKSPAGVRLVSDLAALYQARAGRPVMRQAGSADAAGDPR